MIHRLHKKRLKLSVLTALVALAVALPGLALPAPAEAAVVTWTEDAFLNIQALPVNLLVRQGSQADQLNVFANRFTVTVAAGEKFTFLWQGPNPGYLANDGGLQACLLISGNNHMEVLGPKTITITPDNTRVCAPAGGGGGGGSIPAIVVNDPNGSQVLGAGDTRSIRWSASGFGLVTIKLLLSADEGQNWALIADNEINDGQYLWTVPNVNTEKAVIKAEVISSSGSMLRSDTSDNVFTITWDGEDEEGTAGGDPFIDPNVSGGYDKDSAMGSTSSINSDKSIQPAPEGAATYCMGGSLIKSPTNTAVYYCGADGKRYVFPNSMVYFSWYDNFDSVVVITAAELAMIPLGGNVTYKPGSRMVKIQSDPKTYVVARGGILRWVTTEAVAVALYGPTWNQFIDDINVAFFLNYEIGDPITEADVGL